MIDRAKARCPESTDIPWKDLVRLQFTPQNPYSSRALSFTSQFNVQFKIQRRQLRKDHEDARFYNAQFRHLKERAIQIKNQCDFLCCHSRMTKPKYHLGNLEQHYILSANNNISSTLVAMDHDMTKGYLTPSVILKCNIPESADKSFVWGS